MSTTTPTPDDQHQDLVPRRLRATCYVLGITLGLGVAPSLLALGMEAWAGVAAALAGAANVVALGYLTPPRRGA